uniref:Uncharacterized protein n=1 Tax=Anguilla anguilla TaxID=7936 RepID=A0A0E9WMN9_ANGAN
MEATIYQHSIKHVLDQKELTSRCIFCPRGTDLKEMLIYGWNAHILSALYLHSMFCRKTMQSAGFFHYIY